MRRYRHTLTTPRRRRRLVVRTGHPRLLLVLGYVLTGAVLALGPTPAVAVGNHDHPVTTEPAPTAHQDPMAGHDMGSMSDEDMAGHDGAGHNADGHGEAASVSRPLGAVLGVFGAVILAVLVTAFVWRRRLASPTRTSRPRATPTAA